MIHPPVDMSIGGKVQPAKWLEIVQWSEWRTYRKPQLLFQKVP